MFRNYLLTALRNLLRNRLFSVINIGGLAIGLAACLLILLFVTDELGYDTWIPDAEQIQRVEVTFYPPGRSPIPFVQTPGPVKHTFESDFPGDLEAATRFFRNYQLVTIGERQFNDAVDYVDPEFFSIFPLDTVGDFSGTLPQNGASAILSGTLAEKYFGAEDPIGQVMTIDGQDEVVVVGIFEDIPENSHLETGLITILDEGHHLVADFIQRWGASNLYTYVKFREGVDAAAVTAGLPDYVRRNVTFNFPGLEDVDPVGLVEFHLLPVTDIHLKSSRPGNMKAGGDIAAVYTFSAIALLILLIACFNFMNLTTAKSIQRAREVSLRKVVGASRDQLIRQFLGETILMTIVATILALGITEMVLPWYNDFLGKSLELSFLKDSFLIVALFGLALFVGIFGGGYPAVFLSSFRPAEILKANQSSAEASPILRNILVFLQFTISIGLIVSTAIIYGQTVFARNLDLGFDSEQKLVIGNLFSEDVQPSIQTLKDEVERIPGVLGSTFSQDVPPLRSNNNTVIKLPDLPEEELLVVETITVDADFFQVLDVAPLAGRLFSPEFRSDLIYTQAHDDPEQDVGVIINESTIARLGFGSAENAVGQQFRAALGEGDFYVNVTVVGVIPDVKLRSVHFDVSPTMFYVREDSFGWLTVNIAADNFAHTVEQIDAAWSRIYPGTPIQRTFMGDDLEALYMAEETRGNMLAGFSSFAILVACLGLFGLSSYSAERRTKEIGIRKVFGASVMDIVKMLVLQFSKPVLLANLIAWPVAWYFMNEWLSGFVYRIDMNPFYFVVAGTIALMIAWATVSGHALKVARSHPSNALRYE